MADYIPHEIVIEILARLPVDSLLRFKSVCKSWYSLIKSPNFIAKHLDNSKSNSDKLLVRTFATNGMKERYLVFHDDERFGGEYLELNFPFKNSLGYFRVVGSCNGLLFLSDDFFSDKNRVIVWNPSIRKLVNLPAPHKPQGPYMFAFGFGAHPTTHEFKVIRIGYEMRKGVLDRYEVPPKVEVYTQGTGLWRDISSVAPPYCITAFCWSQAFLNGAVHWIAYDPSMVGGFSNLILSFNMGSETFSEIMLPPTLAKLPPTSLSVKLLGESLAVLRGGDTDTGHHACSIWVMKEYGVPESWTQLFDTSFRNNHRISGFRKNGEVLLARHDSLLSYAPGTQTFTDTGIRGCLHAFYVGTYMETLVSVENRNGV